MIENGTLIPDEGADAPKKNPKPKKKGAIPAPEPAPVSKRGARPKRKPVEQVAEEVLDVIDGLNIRERLFVKEYLQCRNASEAARRAGYSERSAGQIAHVLLKKHEVSRALELGIRQMENDAAMDAAWVLRGFREVVERSLTRKPVMEFDAVERCMVQKVDALGRDVWEYDSAGANRALEAIGKHLGMFNEKPDPSGANGRGQFVGSIVVIEKPPETPPESTKPEPKPEHTA